MNRIRFLHICSSACLVSAAWPLIQSCAPSIHYASYEQEGRRLSLSKIEFQQADQLDGYRPFVLIQVDGLEFPICVYRHSESDYSALYLRCTHQGCQVDVYPSALVCPCHGSEFDTHGKLTQSPAEIDLQKFEVELSEQNVYIKM